MLITEKSIMWYSRKLDLKEIIFICESFYNVTLIGSRGCINYNPVLALRQLGYPMLEKPDEEVVKELILHDWGTTHPYMLQRIIYYWEKVYNKGRELGKKNVISKEPYTQWFK